MFSVSILGWEKDEYLIGIYFYFHTNLKVILKWVYLLECRCKYLVPLEKWTDLGKTPRLFAPTFIKYIHDTYDENTHNMSTLSQNIIYTLKR